jgi:transcriptional regulator with XRE-family HTH domain
MKTNFDKYVEEEIKKDPSLKEQLVKAEYAVDISIQLSRLRKLRELTQNELAELVGVSQSNIARLENSDYEGYSLNTLRKIAQALDARVKVSLMPEEDVEVEMIVPRIGQEEVFAQTSFVDGSFDQVQINSNSNLTKSVFLGAI